MKRNTCPKCGNISYSAGAEGQWICPYCGEDITVETAESLDTRENL